MLPGLVLAAAALLAAGWFRAERARVRASREPGEAEFTGAQECAACHAREFNLWMGSHHQLAMQPAADRSVLGDFNGATLTYDGVETRFFRRGSKFFVHTDGPDGAMHDYRIEYAFGAAPLQQYLIAMPGGRLQALTIAWDSRLRAQGGQRWFHLYANQKITAGNPLHWTGIDQNWNFMCADCHSTNVRKNYDFNSRRYNTTYAEIDVACEACHGPGSRHVAWARNQRAWNTDRTKGLLISLDQRKGARWQIDPATGNARRGVARSSRREIQMCARCHSRRSQIHEAAVHGQAVGDDYRVALLDHDLYYPDGQIMAEDYEYGSFIQSRMFHAGVTCSDCHDPHSLKPRAQGNGLCLQCHAAAKYDSPSHHFHRAGSAGARCVECHMPATVYMTVDARRDHSLRIPRPDLSVKLGVPNACNRCHSGRSPQWAADAVLKWYGQVPAGFQRYAEALWTGTQGAPGALKMLAEVILDTNQPAIARASAVVRIGVLGDPSALPVIQKAASDRDPLVRRAVAQALSGSDFNVSAPILSPLLNDPVRAVRIEAAQALAGAPAELIGGGEAPLRHALDEYIAAQELDADRPEAHMNLALVFTQQKEFDKAESQLRDALALEPSFAPAAVNLADLYRELGRETEGARVLRQAIAREPDDAALQHALGLLLIRQGSKQEALEHLAAAVRLDPSNARDAYVYAVALEDAGHSGAAIEVLHASLERHPFERDTLAELASLYEKAGNSAAALIYAKRLKELAPDGRTSVNP